jgi:hypothetical protein
MSPSSMLGLDDMVGTILHRISITQFGKNFGLILSTRLFTMRIEKIITNSDSIIKF